MNHYRADLHVHSVLSPCAEVEMIPPLIVQAALEHGLNLIAITDRNASENAAAVLQAAAGSGLTVLPGMETQSREDVHLLCLFETLEALQAWQQQINQALPCLPNRPEYFGEQFVVDSSGEFIRREERLLLTATRFSVEEIFEQASALGGLVIPAHVDRPANGLLTTLGVVSPAWQAAAFEISRHLSPDQARRRFPSLQPYPLIQNGDVHSLEQFLGSLWFEMEHPTLKEIRLALQGADERRFGVNIP